MKLNKLTFATPAEWQEQRAILYSDIEEWDGYNGTYTINGDTIIEIGNIPLKPEYDDDGKNINEGLLHDDFAVDIYSAVRVQLPNQFFVAKVNEWYHSIMGANPDIEIQIDNHGMDIT